MKFLHRPSDSRIHKEDVWKKSAYAFVPNQTHFGELCGFAEDVVKGGQGFGMHPHKNMEITTILAAGAQAHKDDTGSAGIISPNDIQTMSAGTGIMHSEFNASKTDSFHSFQIWVYPKTLDVQPRRETFTYQPADKLNQVLLALSPDRRKQSALINQDAFFSVCQLSKNRSLNYEMNLSVNGVYIHCVEGAVNIEGFLLNSGDALGVYDTQTVLVNALADTELIFVEVPMYRGVVVG